MSDLLVTAVDTLGFRNLVGREARARARGSPCCGARTGPARRTCWRRSAWRSPGARAGPETSARRSPSGSGLARVEVEVRARDGAIALVPVVARSRPASAATWSTTARRSRSTPSCRPALAIFLPERLALVKGPPAVRRAHLDRFFAALWPARARGAAPLRPRAGAAQRPARADPRGHGAASDSLDAWEQELGAAGRRAGRDAPRGRRPAGAGVRRRCGAISGCRGEAETSLRASLRRRRAGRSWPPSCALGGNRTWRAATRLTGPIWTSWRLDVGRAVAAALRLAGRAAHGGARAAVRRATSAARTLGETLR